MEEKNYKKDSLIKKLAETVVRSPERHSVIDSLRYANLMILALKFVDIQTNKETYG